jgi:CRISPR associated protein
MFLAQVSIDVVNAVRHLKPFLQPSALDDESLILKTILWEGFSGGAIRPWSIQAQRGPTTIIVGYSRFDASELNKRRALALPSVQEAGGEAIAVSLPSLSSGERYRFTIRLVPTIRVTKAEGRRYGERDAFLVKADAVGKDAGLKRDEVYRAYLAERLLGATVEDSRLRQFRLRKFMRPQKDGSVSGKTMPEAVIEGHLRVGDPVRDRHWSAAGLRLRNAEASTGLGGDFFGGKLAQGGSVEYQMVANKSLSPARGGDPGPKPLTMGLKLSVPRTRG